MKTMKCGDCVRERASVMKKKKMMMMMMMIHLVQLLC